MTLKLRATKADISPQAAAELWDNMINALESSGGSVAKEAAAHMRFLRDDPNYVVYILPTSVGELLSEEITDKNGDKVRWMSWNPFRLLITDNATLSPMENTAHEVDHIRDAFLYPNAHIDDLQTPDPDYRNKEERRATVQRETDLAKELKHLNDPSKPSRKGRGGTELNAISPNSTKSVSNRAIR